MTLSSGFFNSSGGDRLYEAEDFANYLKGIITNGCFPNDTGFLVTANAEPIGSDPPSVIIGAGKAYYDGLWCVNSAPLIFPMGDTQQVGSGLFHLLYFCFDINDIARTVTIEHICSSNPVLPTDGAGKYYMPLAKVTDHQSNQPEAADVVDQRWYAGVSSTGITAAAQMADHIVTAIKIGTDVILNNKIVLPLANNLVTEVMIADNVVGMGKLKDPTVLPCVYMNDADSFKTEQEIGNGTTDRLKYDAISNSRMKVDVNIILDGSTVSATRTVTLRIKYRENTGRRSSSWGSWVDVASIIKTVSSSTHWADVSFSGVFDMLDGRDYEVCVIGDADEFIDAYRMRIFGVVGTR